MLSEIHSKETLYNSLLVAESKTLQPLWRLLGSFLSNRHTPLPCGSTRPTLGVHPRNEDAVCPQEDCTKMLTAAQLLTPIPENPNVHPESRIDKLWNTYLGKKVNYWYKWVKKTQDENYTVTFHQFKDIKPIYCTEIMTAVVCKRWTMNGRGHEKNVCYCTVVPPAPSSAVSISVVSITHGELWSKNTKQKFQQ